MTMARRKLGRSGPEVGAIGLGCMGMSDFYGPADRAESLATIAAALESGATLIDTGDFYGSGHNELLIAEALKGRRREDVVLSVKFGAMRDPSGGWVGADARPKAVKNFLAYSLKRLGADYVDIYRPARLDPDVPIEDTVGAIGELIDAGYVRHVGLSEVGAKTIRRAAAVRPIADLQIEYSLIARMIEGEILTTCRELGVGDHRLRRARARPHFRPLVEGARRERPTGVAPPRASQARTSTTISRWSKRCAPSRKARGASVAAIAVGLGAGARRRHSAARRRAPARAVGGVVGRRRAEALVSRPRRDRGGDPQGRREGRALSGAGDGASRQREARLALPAPSAAFRRPSPPGD